jgi:hypothetical protein
MGVRSTPSVRWRERSERPLPAEGGRDFFQKRRFQV